MAKTRKAKDPVLWGDVGVVGGVAPLDERKLVKREHSRVRSVDGGIGDVETAGALGGTYEADFGSTPVYSGTFTVTAVGVTTSMDVTANIRYSAPTGKDLDELEFAEFQVMTEPGTDQFTLYMNSMNGPVADKFKISWVAA